MSKEIPKNSHKPGRKQKPINADDLRVARLSVAAAHRTLRTWDAVAEYYGISKAAAHRLANDPQYRPSQATIDKLLAVAQPKTGSVKLPVPSRPARHYYRPCLPVELGQQVKLHGIDAEALLTQAVKSAILDEQWSERMNEV